MKEELKTQLWVPMSLCCMQQTVLTVMTLTITKYELWVGCGGVGFFNAQTNFFLPLPHYFLPLFSLPPSSLRNPGMPCLWSLPIWICHIQSICVQDLACNVLQFWQRKFRTYGKCPTDLAKNTILFINLECPSKASKCFTRKKIAHSTLFNTKTYISLQI